MVEINNQRKAFDMLRIGGTDNGRQKTRNHGYDVIVYVESYLLITRSPSQTCHAKPKLKPTGAGRYQLFSCWWDAYRKKPFVGKTSPKSQDAVGISRLRSVALYL